MTEPLARDFRLEGDGDVRRLEAALRALDTLGLAVWIDQGTLLGLIREGRLLPLDTDIDLGIWEEDWQRHGRALRSLLRHEGLWSRVESHRLKVFRPGEPDARPIHIAFHSLDGDHARKHFLRKRRQRGTRTFRLLLGFLTGGFLTEALIRVRNVLRRARSSRLRHFGDTVAVWVDVVSCTRHDVLVRLGVVRLRDRMTGEFGPVVCPAEHLLTLEPVRVNGLNARLPSDSLRYLEFKYGLDWRTPVPRANWDFWTEDGGAREAARLADEFPGDVEQPQPSGDARPPRSPRHTR